MAEALTRVLDHPTVSQRLVTGGRACVVQYDWPSVTDRVLAYYRCLLGGNGGDRAGDARVDVASDNSESDGQG
jgi:hypothetical protein